MFGSQDQIYNSTRSLCTKKADITHLGPQTLGSECWNGSNTPSELDAPLKGSFHSWNQKESDASKCHRMGLRVFFLRPRSNRVPILLNPLLFSSNKRNRDDSTTNSQVEDVKYAKRCLHNVALAHYIRDASLLNA